MFFRGLQRMFSGSNSRLKLIFLMLTSFLAGSYFGYLWEKGIYLTSLGPAVIPQNIIERGQHSRLDDDNDDGDKPIHTCQSVKAVGSCTPQPNVMFLKTHKTASSAVQNVLLRYADKHKLTVALSNTNDIRFKYGRPFQSHFVAPTLKPVNIICHHMVFNYEELKKVMQRNTTYVTILREPGTLFESLFDYMHYDSKPFARVKKQPNALEFWLNHTSTFFRGKNDGQFWWFAKNGLFFDMGYDNLQDDDKYIQNAISELEKRFDLVLLADYFDESMLLLKDHLCWSMSDIVALKTNARDAAKTPLTPRLVKKIREWNKADAMIYDHFNKTFWRRVEEYGRERMFVDLKLLVEIKAEIREACIEGDAVSNKYIKDTKNKVYNPRGVIMKGYNLKDSAKDNSTCINLLKGEIQWTRELMAERRTQMKITSP